LENPEDAERLENPAHREHKVWPAIVVFRDHADFPDLPEMLDKKV
jgi:hypothetical protein